MFEDILNKIYQEGLRFEDIKDFIYPALKGIDSINNFFDILFTCIRNYAEQVKYCLLNDLTNLIQEKNNLDINQKIL